MNINIDRKSLFEDNIKNIIIINIIIIRIIIIYAKANMKIFLRIILIQILPRASKLIFCQIQIKY